MGTQGKYGHLWPKGESSTTRALTDIAADVRENAAAQTLRAATIDAGGLQIINGGSLKVVDSDGHVVALFGSLPSQYNRADGSSQPGMMVYREDGSLAACLADLNPTTPPFKAAWQVLDRNGWIVLSDDTNSGHGLANPTLETCGFQNTNVTTWMATNSTSYTVIGEMYLRIQNPLLTWQISLYSDAGVTSNFQIGIGGTQVGTTQTVSPNTFSTWSANASLPAGVSIGDTVYCVIQAKTSATTGSARASCLRMSGQSS